MGLTATEAGSQAASSPAPAPPPPRRRRPSTRQLTLIRRTLLGLYALALLILIVKKGVPEDRNELLAILAVGLLLAGIGKRSAWLVVRDWLPFAIILAIYDQTRGIAALLGRPTEWYLQARIDEAMFGGTDPVVWLQSHLKQALPPWWEVPVSTVYVSYYLSPYLVAGYWWLKNRDEWKKFVARFVAMSFIGLAGFILMPAAPPWAASQCHPADLVGGPANPPCIQGTNRVEGDPGILKQAVVPHHDGAKAYVERITGRGFERLGLKQASALVETGQAHVNLVAAVPSLHAATTLLVSVFLWPRVRKRWRPLLAAYPLAMAFVLVYAGEHYVFDILLGWLITFGVCFGLDRWDARRAARSRTADRGAAVSRADSSRTRSGRTALRARTRPVGPGQNS